MGKLVFPLTLIFFIVIHVLLGTVALHFAKIILFTPFPLGHFLEIHFCYIEANRE
jgi:hypothetical protein